MLGEFEFEVALATPTVVLAEADVIHLDGTAAVKRVMGAARVLDDGHHLAGSYGPKLRALAEIDVAVQLDGVGGIVTVCQVVSAKAQEIDRLLTFKIDETQAFPLAHHGAPRLAGRNDRVFADARTGGEISR